MTADSGACPVGNDRERDDLGERVERWMRVQNFGTTTQRLAGHAALIPPKPHWTIHWGPDGMASHMTWTTYEEIR